MERLFTVAIGFPTGLALYAISSHLLLQAGGTLPLFLWPLCILGGLLAGTRIPRPDLATVPADRSNRLPRWLDRAMPWIAASLLGLATGLMVYGSVGSLARDWDGFILWSLKAHYLVPPTSLDQPYFTDPAIYASGMSYYPPLQPLCLGAMRGLLGDLSGQLLFPILYVASIATVFLALAHRGLTRSEAWIGALAFGLTPMWLNRGAGAVDSGYADLFLAYALILAGAGLLLSDLRLLFLGALFLPLIKPEGTVYALALGLITATSAPTRHHYATAWGLTLALLLWLPLRTGDGDAMSFAGPLLILGALVAIHKLHRRVSPRTMLGIGLGIAGGTLIAVFVAEDALRSSSNLLLRDFVVHILDPVDRLAKTPQLLLGYAKAVMAVNDFGLLFLLAFALLLLPRRMVGRIPCRPLAIFFLVGLALACTAMLLSPDTDLEHVFRSRFDRLLLHWVGPGWLLTAVWMFGTPGPTVQAGD